LDDFTNTIVPPANILDWFIIDYNEEKKFSEQNEDIKDKLKVII
jgi:hypothetical protein